MLKNWLKLIISRSIPILLIFNIFFICDVYSQKRSAVDSLIKLLNNSKDSARVAVLRQLSWEYRNLDTSLAISYGNQALEMAEKLNLFHEKADILSRLGVIKRNQGKYSQALDYYFKGLEITSKYGFYDLQALEFNNIGDIYNRIGIYDKAMEYTRKALVISLKSNDKYNLGYIYNIIGLIYKNMSLYDSSLIYFQKSLSLREELNFSSGIAAANLNIGNIQYLKSNFDSSFMFYNSALQIYLKLNDQTGIANAYRGIGTFYNQKKDYKKAIDYFQKSLDIIKKFGDLQIQKESAEGLKYSYSQIGDFEKAILYQDFAVKIKDSIANKLYVEKITQLTENYKFAIKNHENDIVQKQKEEIFQQKINFQKSLLKYSMAALCLLFILIGIIIFFYRSKNKAYQELNIQKSKIDELNEVLISANREIIAKKNEIETQRDNLQEQRNMLEVLNSTKDKLFSILAHDLRSPLSGVIGFSELLYEKVHIFTPEKSKEISGLLVSGSKSILNIINTLLDWAMVQTDQLNMSPRIIDISLIISEVISFMNVTSSAKNISLNYIQVPGIFVYADANMTNTIIRNLISNAIKYSFSGSDINIKIEQFTEEIQICVIDKGVGISDQVKMNLFSSNLNESSFGTNNEKGTGLGLAICKEFTEKQNGRIWVESELGKGSSFYFTLPKPKE